MRSNLKNHHVCRPENFPSLKDNEEGPGEKFGYILTFGLHQGKAERKGSTGRMKKKEWALEGR